MSPNVGILRALLVSALGCGASAPSPAIDPPVTSAALTAGLPGPCVPIPEVAFRIDRVATQASPPAPGSPVEQASAVSVTTARSVDIDGDGQADALVPEPAAGDCNHDLHHAVYIVRGACGHRAGLVVGNAELKAGAAPGTLADLRTTVASGHQEDPRVPAQLRTVTRIYRFDGTAYREVDHQTTEAVCHHCPSMRCTTSPLS